MFLSGVRPTVLFTITNANYIGSTNTSTILLHEVVHAPYQQPIIAEPRVQHTTRHVQNPKLTFFHVLPVKSKKHNDNHDDDDDICSLGRFSFLLPIS